MHYVAHTWQPKLTDISLLWLFPGDLLICYTVKTIPKTRPLILNSVNFLFLQHRPTLFHSFCHYSFFYDWTNRLHTYHKTIKTEAKSLTTPMTKTTAIAGYRAMITCERPSSNYGSPPWNTGAALRFLSLRRDFLRDCWRSNVALKLRSSTRRCC